MRDHPQNLQYFPVSIEGRQLGPETHNYQAEKRFQHGDLSFIKGLAEKVLCVLEGRARSPEGLSVIESLIPARKPRMSDFETSKLIGSGASGSIYLANHKDSHQVFAMKKMDKWKLNTPKKVEWAFQERDILTFADCPFVVSMLCSFPTRSHLCMVMEYVGGGDCRTLLRTRGPLPVPLARLYFAEAVLAVEYLHSYGVVHRDLKPENLLITSTGHIKVTDFGLSKVGVMIPNTNIYKELAEDIAREFLNREDCGTPLYKAPEIILKKGYGRPVDWWSMGIILLEFLLGYVPLRGGSVIELYKSIGIGHIIWNCDRAPPPDAQTLITELLIINPVHRLGTGGVFEIKGHPFLSDLDFDNLLSQKPVYVPKLTSDVDTSLFMNHYDINKHLVSEHTSEDNESLDFHNFISTSERFSKLCTTATRTMDNEDPKSSPEYTVESSTNISEMQKDSVPLSDREDAISSLPSSSPLSEFPAQEERKSSINLSKEQEKSENVEKGNKRRGSIFRRILSSCWRGLSRAARAFACCYCCPETI